MKVSLFILLLISILALHRNTFAQQNYYDPSNPQGPSYNPNSSPQINRGVDSTEEKEDTAKVVKEKFDFWHSPHVATLASAIIPGMGQAYNKKYWKVPLVWGIMGTLGYFLYTNAVKYNDYKAAYFVLRNYTEPGHLYESTGLENIDQRQTDWHHIEIRTNVFGRQNELTDLKYNFYQHSSSDSSFVDNQVAYARDNARRTRDYMGVFILLCYVLNMADAAVDAHFAKFDVSDNLTMKIEPSFKSFMGQPQMGLSLKLNVVDNRNRKLPAIHN